MRERRECSMWLCLSDSRQLDEQLGPGGDSFLKVLGPELRCSQGCSQQTVAIDGDLHTRVSEYSLGQLCVLFLHDQPRFFRIGEVPKAWANLA